MPPLQAKPKVCEMCKEQKTDLTQTKVGFDAKPNAISLSKESTDRWKWICTECLKTMFNPD